MRRQRLTLLNLTLPTPAENLALDEALLDEAEAAPDGQEVLRLWEAERTMVVVGRASQVAQEVDLAACRRDAVPVLRRASGGAAIVGGRGCLMYAVVLSQALRPELRSIDAAHRHVLSTLAGRLGQFSAGIARRGVSDLAIGERKFSGNSLRVKRRHLLYHGTLLYDFALPAIGRYLIEPPRQPDYRRHRSHDTFVTNLPAGREALVRAVIEAWGADEERQSWPERRVAELVAEKYASDAWNLRH
ncbi:MAG TPA: lipoate--protein ligase family protein [Pirellulales bacterium]|nr:lipoate--protein ligase family protein [Pirellulales bacterium]